jgi:hypothetical protein
MGTGRYCFSLEIMQLLQWRRFTDYRKHIIKISYFTFQNHITGRIVGYTYESAECEQENY